MKSAEVVIVSFQATCICSLHHETLSHERIILGFQNNFGVSALNLLRLGGG